MAKKLSLIIFLFFNFYFNFSNTALANRVELKYMPVQDAGRVKPFDTFAREVLSVIYGKSTYEGRQAYEVVFTWMLTPEVWLNKKIFEVRNHEVLRGMKLSETQRYFDAKEIFENDRFVLLQQELQAKRETKEKLTPYFQALQRLENQYFIFTEIVNGRMLKIMPPSEGTSWQSVVDLVSPQKELFMEISKRFAAYLGSKISENPSVNEPKALDELNESVTKFIDSTKENYNKNAAVYPSLTQISIEVQYNSFHPFRWAYIFYILAAVLFLFVWITNKWDNKNFSRAIWATSIIAFVLHTMGFLIRVYLTGRAPVSNMYETVVWVSWGSFVFAMILEAAYKFRYVLFAGLIACVVSLVVADTAPAVLDPSLHPLEPVLRSNYWLTIHVMTITISYAAFLLAFVLGDIGLVYYFRDEKKYEDKIRNIVQAIYRSFQIGVAFLAPGIILGGVWADYSWGRFWGWDPKETWALIVLLGYLAILHGRLSGWIKSFGMVVSAVITFSLVIMAWYGVNFVLGAGLHSYGFGAGGVEYVTGFVLAHILMVIYVTVLRKSRV